MRRTPFCRNFTICNDADTLHTSLIVAMVFVFSGLLVWIVRARTAADRRAAAIVTVTVAALMGFWMWTGLAV